ncbi:MAG TPA: apolipoprotein N-acyltransferase, partial [Pseudobdellovibrionaceae bacterium]|nr:apolipoprotein N-acyltransferase [Pseudobdellovibrionaceae bacterium]
KASRWPLLSGILIGTTYVPFPPWALAFCYAPLFLWLDEDVQTRKQAFFGGWLTQFTLSLIGFHWIAYTAKEFGGFPWSLSVIALLLFAAFIHLHIPLASLAAFELKKRFGIRGAPLLFTTALIFALVERIWPMIFPWHLGYTLLWAKLPIYHWADVIGFAGLSTLVFLLNAWLSWIWQKQDKTEIVFKHVTILGVVLIALTLGGLWRKKAWKSTDSVLNVIGVQANIGNLEKIYAEQGLGYHYTILQKFIDLSRKGAQEAGSADLFVWPETAVAFSPDRPEFSQRYLDVLREGLGDLQMPILTGSFSKDPSYTGLAKDSRTYNALSLIGPNGRLMTKPYRKTHLLIFGEYLPFSDDFPILLKWLPFISSFGRGQGPVAMDLRVRSQAPVKVGGQICYEGLFPDFTRGLSEKGADLLVNVTNDSWFGTPFEPRQHMIMTLARAIEVRRPLIRSTNTGITTAILASGDQLQRSPSDREWTGRFEIKFRKNAEQTLFVRFGHLDWILWISILIGLTIWAAREAKKGHWDERLHGS